MNNNLKIGTTIFFGVNDLTVEERFKAIKEAGFTHLLLSTDRKYEKQNGTWDYQIELSKKYNLPIEQTHSTYTGFDIDSIWTKGVEGDNYLDGLLNDVLLAEKASSHKLVVHVTDKYIGRPTKEGIRRLKKLNSFAKKHDVKVAIENTTSTKTVLETFDIIKDSNFGMCLDLGHLNVFDDGDLMKVAPYKNRIICYHLHDNNRRYFDDEHLPIGEGRIDYKTFKEFSKSVDAPYTLEVLKKKGISFNEGIVELYNSCKILLD